MERKMVKMLCVIMFITCLSVGGCNQEQGDKAEAQGQSETMKTIVAVGDSLTAGYRLDESESYPAFLGKKLQAAGYKYRVVNGGVSGETSSGTLSRMEWILTLEPDIVILETGANDGLRGVDPLLIEKNIRQILEILKEKDVVVVLAGMKMVWNMGPTYISRFNRIYPELSRDFDVIYFPFFLEGVAMKSQLNLGDGIHPNAQGYKIISENIYPYVLEAIEKREG
jgi:acyl-CoA thioesterase-1